MLQEESRLGIIEKGTIGKMRIISIVTSHQSPGIKNPGARFYCLSLRALNPKPQRPEVYP